VVKQLYTTEQVAQLLQIHPLTVLKYIRSGKLHAIKLGRIYRIQESAIEEFLDRETI
jgi:excisionase family DNA binding protein